MATRLNDFDAPLADDIAREHEMQREDFLALAAGVRRFSLATEWTTLPRPAPAVTLSVTGFSAALAGA